MALERRRGYKPDHKSFGAFMLSEQARKPVARIAHELIIPLAVAKTPRSAEDKEHMADNYKVNESTAPVVAGGNPRVGVEVYNDVRHAAAVEHGVGKKKGARPLGKAGAAVGDFVGEMSLRGGRG